MTPTNQNIIELKKWIDEGISDLHVTGLTGAVRAYFLAGLLKDMERPCLIILPLAKDAVFRCYHPYERRHALVGDTEDQHSPTAS